MELTMTANLFQQTIGQPIKKNKITTLQINMGRKCNQVCTHCHVDASPNRTEEMSSEVIAQIIDMIPKFPQIRTIDLTGGAPEMHNGFREIVETASESGIEVIVRSNLTIFFEQGYDYLPDFYAKHKVRVVASLPCYLETNVDSMRGKGTYEKSIAAIKLLNERGYGKELTLDLVFNPALPKGEKFSLAPDQHKLEQDYKKQLLDKFGIIFSNLLVFINFPIGRFSKHLNKLDAYQKYIHFLHENFNPLTLDHLMCKNELSIDYQGMVYDCDFNQIAQVGSRLGDGNSGVTLKTILERESLDIIQDVQVRDYCFGCTAGSGASCGGTLVGNS